MRQASSWRLPGANLTGGGKPLHYTVNVVSYFVLIKVLINFVNYLVPINMITMLIVAVIVLILDIVALPLVLAHSFTTWRDAAQRNADHQLATRRLSPPRA